MNGDITRYVYDRADIVTEYDGSWNVKSKYTHNLGIDDPLTVEQAGNAYYYHKHGLGSVTELTDASGNVIKTYRYKSFGEIYSETGTFNQPFTFTGREYDPESRLYYYRARYYDPRAGRFLTQDPIGFASGDVNLYRYVQNNPINWVDALGLWSPAAHDFMFRFSFLGKLSNSDIARLQQASRSFDSRTQSPNLSYMHSLRQRGQDPEEAIRLRERFIEEALGEARRLARSGNRNAALDRFAEACHPIMDSSSPEHLDRNGTPRIGDPWWPFGHSPNETIGNETVRDLTFDILQRQRILLNNAYDRVFGP